jgi:hypothetical protein
VGRKKGVDDWRSSRRWGPVSQRERF